MRKKSSALKISICTTFLVVFVAATFFSSVSKTSVLKVSGSDSDDSANPQNCAVCHQENFATRHQTSHRNTVRKAAIQTVRGDFGGENRLEYAGVKIEPTRVGESFFIKIGNQSYKVESVVGAKHIEQYVAEKDGELYSLPVAYDLAEKRWINLNEADFTKKTDDLSRHLKNWKTDCAACHRSGENDFANGFEDFEISCAACHGNAAEHVASKTSLRAQLGLATENKIVNPRNLSSDAAMMVCAQCHARDAGELPQIGEIVGVKSFDNLIAAHQTDNLDSEKHWADGSNRLSGNEFQAIARSVCYVQSKAGGHGIAGEKINCSSCHVRQESSDGVLSSEISAKQNCVQCHSQFADDAAVAEHTKHPLDSEASNCARCHQPETVYGRMRFVRTHEISVPDPALTAEKQVPNACNLCHADQSVNWAIASGKKLWAERFRAAETFADKQFDRPEGVRGLASNDALTRALAADSLRKHSDSAWSAPFLFKAYRTEEFPLVKRFLAAALESDKRIPSKIFKAKKPDARKFRQPSNAAERLRPLANIAGNY